MPSTWASSITSASRLRWSGSWRPSRKVYPAARSRSRPRPRPRPRRPPRNESPVSALAQAASVLLARGPEAAEVLLVHRAEQLRFFGGFWAFPGGKVAPEDGDRTVTAARELFEETGVLVARRADGTFPAASPELTAARNDVLSNRR